MNGSSSQASCHCSEPKHDPGAGQCVWSARPSLLYTIFLALLSKGVSPSTTAFSHTCHCLSPSLAHHHSVLHLSYLSIIYLCIVVALETAMCHTLYFFAPTALYANIHCSKSLDWFMVSEAPQILDHWWDSSRISRSCPESGWCCS